LAAGLRAAVFFLAAGFFAAGLRVVMIVRPPYAGSLSVMLA
jgi:hypothetical protein